MTHTKNEALQMCLEYIETDAHERKYVRHAIKQALAAPVQPVQEPEIVQRVKRYAGQTMRTARNPNITARECIELANWIVATPPAAQRQWVGLTQEERLHFLNEILDYGTGFVAPLDSVIWSIEAKLKEKNNG
jgi:hypothetical protein